MMKKFYSIVSVFLLVGAICCSNMVSAQGYYTRLAQQCNTTTAGTETLSFTGTFPNANGNGTLTIVYQGDLDSPTFNEIITFNGETAGALGVTTSVTQCSGVDSVTYTIPMATLNAWAATGNKIDITCVSGSGVNNFCVVGSTSSVSFCVTGTLSYPFATVPNDAGTSSITPTILCPSSDSVRVKIHNYGTNQIDSVWVNWRKNGTLQTPIHLKTLLDTATGTGSSSAIVNLGLHTFTAGSTENFEVWTTMPNGVADTTTNNDTTRAGIKPSLSGTYTIGGTTPDYATFALALADLNSIGICGPTVFNVRQGTYNEKVSIGTVVGSSSSNTITFQSDPANTAMPLIQSTGSSADNYVLRIATGGQYITFDSLNFKATGNTYSTVVSIPGASSHITINDCKLDGYASATTSTWQAILYQNGGLSHYNTFTNNTLNDGSYGIYFRGTGTATRGNGNVVTNNTLNNPYYYPVYLYMMDTLTFDNNTIVQDPTSTSFCYGVYAYYCNNAKLRKNSIQLNTTSTNYGLRIGRFNGTSNEVSNNMVVTSGRGTATSTAYGIYFDYNKNVNVYHNTVNVRSGSPTNCRAIYVSGSSSTAYGNNNIRNNIFVNNTGAYAIDVTSGAANATYLPKLDNNIYYSSGTNPFRYSNINYATLALYQAVSVGDTNSYFGDPGFYGATNLHLQGTLAIDSGANLGITTDIDGDVRPLAPSTGYDIGADEYIPPTCPSPTSITTAFLTADSATVTWTNGPSDSTWIVEYGAAGFTPGTGTTIPSNNDTVSISGLSPLNCYDVWVKSICTVGDTSILYGPYNFCTPCASYTPAYMQDFTTGMSWSTVPTCWDEAKGQLTVSSSLSYGTSNWTGDGFGNVGFSGAAQMQVNYTGRYEWLISPSIDLGTGTTPYQVEFDIAMTNFYNPTRPIGDSMGHDDKVALVISTDDGTTWSDTNVLRQWDTLDIPSHTGDYFAYNLTAAGYTGKVRLAIYGESTVTNQRNEVFIDNFNVVQVPTCPRPTKLRLDSSTTTTAVMNWINGASDVSWLLEYGPVGFTPGTGTTVPSATNPGTISGLTHSTCYDVYMRSICGVGDTSIQIGPQRVCTKCAPIADFCTDFESAAANEVPLCWSSYINSTSSFATVQTLNSTFNAYSGNHSVRMYNQNDASATLMLISPEISNLSAGNRRASFWAKGDTNIYIGTMTDPTNPATYFPIDTLENLSRTAYTNYRIDFSGYTGTDKYIAIFFKPQTTYDYAYIDDFCWEIIPSCEKAPAVKILNAGVDSTSLNIGWNIDTTQASYMVAYGPAGYDPVTNPAGGDTTTSTTNFKSVTNLQPLTEYCFWVKAICKNGDTSFWDGPHCAKTGCPSSTPFPYADNFADYKFVTGVGEQLPQCWTEGKGQFDSITTVTIGTSNWTYDGFANVGTDGSAKMNIYSTNRAEWYISPAINLGTDPNQTHIVEFDIAMTDYANTSAGVVGDDDTLAFVISYNGGLTWKKADILELWDTGNVPSNTGDHFKMILHNKTGIVKFGFYAASTVSNEDNDWFIDNFSIKDTVFVGIDEISFEESFKVYPNPNNGVFTIVNEGIAQQSSIKLLDIQGRIVYDDQYYFTKNGKKQIELSNLTGGVYVLLIQSEGKQEQYRIVIE